MGQYRFAIDSANVATARKKMVALTMVLTMLLCIGYCYALPSAMNSPLGFLSLLLFTILAAWVSLGFSVAMLGIAPMLRASRAPIHGTAATANIETAKVETTATVVDEGEFPVDRVALLVPIYNEDAAAVMACLKATAESLKRTGRGKRFDFFILSDTTNPEIWLREELLWSQVRSEMEGGYPSIHYRHRSENRGRKAGNIGEFLGRWGLDYRYFVILDADSTMDGETLVELARRMDANDRLGILQAPPIPEGNESIWARTQQFAARAYGPLFNYGLVAWTGSEGNYWGHNAIIRTQAFLRHCGLSKLPGPEPLGGEVLSHDFVEAALMRRAGYEVHLAADLEGGFEQCPTTVEDHARRDQRWCQGNLQHLRIAVAPAWHPVSRVHFLSGAISYLASPLWLAFLVVGVLLYLTDETPSNPAAAITVFTGVMSLLLLPKCVAIALQCHTNAKRFGGMFSLVSSMIVESLVSIAVAPIMMLYHSRFVILTLIGSKVRWGAQTRTDNGLGLIPAIRCHGLQSVIGVTATVLLATYSPELLPWASPLLFGLVFAIPLAMMFASSSLGRLLARLKLLSTPEETTPPRVLRRRDVLVRQFQTAGLPSQENSSLFVQVLRDPATYRLHQSLLAASVPPPDNTTNQATRLSVRTLRRLRKLARENKLESIPKSVRRTILSDAEALQKLHLEYWSGEKTAA